MKPFKFFVITDTHYFAKSLGAYGDAYEDYMDFEQKCYAETPYINDAIFDYLANQSESDTVLIAGDLTFNGERASHDEFVQLLKKLKDSGKRVCVVTAGHDVQPHPFQYAGGEKEAAENIVFADLYDYYKDYGYDEAVALYRKNLCYVAQLTEGVRLLVLCNDGEEGRNLAYSDEILEWAVQQAKKAREDNQLMIAMEHYPVLAGQPILQLIPDARQKESKKLYTALADNGVNLIFTGHMHNQSINVVETEKGNKFYDVCTGSAIGCPAFMRLCTVEDEKTISIKSIPVPDFEWDTKGKSCEVYLKEQFERMIRSLVTGMETDPMRVLRKLGAGDKENLAKPLSFIGRKLNKWTVGDVGRILCVKVNKEIKNIKFVDFAIDMVRYVFEGDQPWVEGTPEGDTVLRLLRRFNPVLKKVSKKLHGSQGEDIDLYDVLKHSIGNYGISDSDATLVLR